MFNRPEDRDTMNEGKAQEDFTMRKCLSMLLVLIMFFALAACGGNSTPDTAGGSGASESGSTPSASQNGGATSGADNENDITVSYANIDYGAGGAFIDIELVSASEYSVHLAEVEDMDAAAAGFSTTGDFKLTTISAGYGFIIVFYDGTEDNYGTIPDITYTKPAEPILVTTDGTPVESFSHTLPYRSFDLMPN